MKAETLLPLGKLDPGLRAPEAARNDLASARTVDARLRRRCASVVAELADRNEDRIPKYAL